jgi:hypothetical protein
MVKLGSKFSNFFNFFKSDNQNTPNPKPILPVIDEVVYNEEKKIEKN